MNEIYLSSLKLKAFTEQDALDYCSINNINPLNIKELNLSVNKLTDISGIKLFKNLKGLYLYNNKVTDISVLKDLTKLKILYIYNNEITDISIIKNLNKLEYLDINNNKTKDISALKDLNKLKLLELGFNKIKDISVILNFKNLEKLNITNLKLESDQYKHIKSLNNLKYLFCRDGFKDMSVLDQFDKNIRIIKN